MAAGRSTARSQRALTPLAAELRQGPVSARGVAAIRVLITDGVHSPLYRSGASGSLDAALLRARHWL